MSEREDMEFIEPCLRRFQPATPAEEMDNDIARYFRACAPHLDLKKLTIDLAYACAINRCLWARQASLPLLELTSINTVTLKHYQDSCWVWNLPLAHPNRLPNALDKLHFLIATWTDLASSDMDIELEYRHDFFNVQLHASWLQPLQSQLTHLTLHCNTYWGVYPMWQPNNLHFPRLKSLAFGKWTIIFEWQIDFIASHSATLEQLIFTSCPILHAMRMTARQYSNSWRQRLPGTTRGPPPTEQFFPPLRWHTVLPELQSKLPKLEHFSMARGARGEAFWGRADRSADEAFEDRYTQAACIDESRYAIFDFANGTEEYIDVTTEFGMSRSQGVSMRKESGFENSNWLEKADEETRKKVRFPDCEREDREALEGLLATVRGRWA